MSKPDIAALVERLLLLADGKWQPTDEPFNHDKYCSLIHAERDKTMREAAAVLSSQEELLRRAGEFVQAIGSGHSFSAPEIRDARTLASELGERNGAD